MSRSDFTTVRVVGGLLPTDVLGRVLAGDKDLGGLTGGDYHLPAGEAPREAANRAWSYLLGAWQSYRVALAKLPDGDPAVGLTREKWLTVLFRELGYGRLQPTPAGGLVVDDRTFPVSHLWGATPLHLLGWGVDLDKRTKGVPGAADRAPQAMVQELLNRTDAHLWAVLGNGRTIRLLRDSTSLAGQAYVEFDLESMFDGEVFSDFVLLYLLLHQSRVEVPVDAIPADCWLEKWRTAAAETGTRALGLLRDGVKDALEALGTGFLQAPGNDLSARIADGALSLEDYHRSLLRLVYRLLFLFVTEDRGLLLDPDADQTAVRRYHDFYATARLRALVRKRRGARHIDQWEGLQLVIAALGQVGGQPLLGLPGLGGIFNPEPVDVVMGQHLPNEALFTAVRRLSIVHPKGSPPRVVDYRNLGAEELGSIYESLLELVPRHDRLERTFTLENLAGNDRKTSGSYYTPSSLIDLVLDEALDPLLDEREKDSDPEQALLAMTVCDPACGSGHFLVAAARRIATRLASVRTGEADPTPADIQAAMHDVVARCIYGVDLNPMAAELAKVSLWLEAMQPGKPLSFLDAHIKVGNALLGTTPELLAAGVPDAAFVALTGDDRKWVTALKKRNKAEREQSAQGELFDTGGLTVDTRALAGRVRDLEQGASASLDDVHRIEQRYRDLEHDPAYANARLVADAWCAAFVCPKAPDAPVITHGVIEQLQADPSAEAAVRDAVHRIAVAYRFFHWYLEFPQVFGGKDPGFTCMVGNPPWEILQMSEQEFFASRDETIANAANAAARKRMIAELAGTRPELFAEFQATSRRGEGDTHYIRSSGRFPLTARGKINTYSIFAETMRDGVSATGAAGVITPTGLATDATTAFFMSDTLQSRRLLAFYDFENEARIFDGVHHAFRFAVSALAGRARAPREVRFAFYTRHVADVVSRRFALSADEVLLLNPNTGTLPVFRSRTDAEITLGIYRRFPILIRDSPPANHWGLSFRQGLFNMASDSHLFRTAEDLESIGATFDGWAWAKGDERWLPLYEAKMLSHWDTRFSTYEGATQAELNAQTLPRLGDAAHDQPTHEAAARYWIGTTRVQEELDSASSTGWLLGWRKITGSEKWRTFVPVACPASAAGDSIMLAFTAAPAGRVLLQTVWSSYVHDFVTRQKMTGTNLQYFIVKQLACPAPAVLAVHERRLSSAANELMYTSWRMAQFSRGLGDDGPPFRWIPLRREAIKCELDALMFHIYGLTRPDVEHVMDSFLVVRKYDERDYGEFRTKRLILEYYDLMAEAMAADMQYQTPIDPPPGQGPRHDASTRPDWLTD